MQQNIILCADGTGNRGGTTPDTNVYRIYQAINLRCGSAADEGGDSTKQISFYDVGVGTASNKYLKAISGAFGFGFADNVKDLYIYLARNYNPGTEEQRPDNVFLFGFSRGAAEVRALNGMIAAVGLVDGRNLEDSVLRERVETVFKSYKQYPTHESRLLPDPGKNHGAIQIAFLGVWDTVSALGFPQNWPKATFFLRFFNQLFNWLDRGTEKFDRLKHRFYNYDLTLNVSKACHAIAIDDQRLSFHPMVWDENDSPAQNTDIHQVWFPGMHSNVGGGYGRTELSYVTLQWMLNHAIASGMQVCDGFSKEVAEKANPNGVMHNSRDGMAVFYRYTPRNLTQLSRPKSGTNIKVHESVVSRMKNRIQWYAPDALPKKFDRVKTSPSGETCIGTIQLKTPRQEEEAIAMVQKKRIVLYSWFLELVLVLFLLTLLFWNERLFNAVNRGIEGLPSVLVTVLSWPVSLSWLADLVKQLSPTMFDNFANIILLDYPLLGIGIAATGWVMNRKKNKLRTDDQKNLSRLRQQWIEAINATDSE